MDNCTNNYVEKISVNDRKIKCCKFYRFLNKDENKDESSFKINIVARAFA